LRRLNAPVLVLLAAALLAAVAASWAFLFGHSSTALQTVASVSHGQEGGSDRVAALGRLEPGSGIINLAAGAGPDRLESLLIERGDFVKKGQVVGYLGGYAEQMAQVDVLHAQLEEAKSRMKAETALNLLRINELNGRRVLELSPHRISAQAEIVASLKSRQAPETEIQAARERLAELKQQFEIDKADVANQIEQARATLERTQTEFPIASLKRQIALAEVRAKRMTLFSPCDCKVLDIRIRPGEAIGSGPVLTIGNTNAMRVVAEVYETDIAKVRLGQKAVVSSRALPKPITGTVARVGNMIFKNDVLNVDPAARADARVVQVWIDLDDPAGVKELTNLTVDVLITTDERHAPPRAVEF
jgi:HlyD family secretion protein